ncbi:YbhB/YbcL family Raf kinase inhibitor-like protein [Pollutimonas subterranea]|uniref:YbhB/YbcL family Raf kinase inhibitor-like protein n=1 Tax=Pollutimonas subterranea TaxID=2045210 RepID=A0A2N4TZN9_9BURK|nr:YbhB/YbcL family Raf kinase inhibitor-like protein [Pollutimonas subterranea]PLC48229.1 YbhB/YbcL family Raf kinase inhibitor-like protein [Pollutimonas subterranea]
MKRTSYSWLGTLCLAIAMPTMAQQNEGAPAKSLTSVVMPAAAPLTEERLKQLQLPKGFDISVIASGLKNARLIAVSENGDIYISRREEGDVLLLRDPLGKDKNTPLPVAHRPQMHGLATHDGKLYMATVKELYVAEIKEDGTLGELELLVDDLPDGGQHPNRSMVFGPDGMIYLSIGSSCNACNETNPEHAAMLRVSPDGKQRTIFASGLRNTIGFAFHPGTGQFWGMDQGLDHLGNDQQPEELNLLERGERYGWPYAWGKDGINPMGEVPGEIARAQWQAMSTPMVLGYTAHASAMQMVFYTGDQFPATYRGDAFVTMRGSWNRAQPSGYEVVRLRFEDGKPVAFEPFVTGFLSEDGKTQTARPIGLAMMPDDDQGTLFRIAYTGERDTAGKAGSVMPDEPPKQPILEQINRGSGVPLLKDRDGYQTGKSVHLQSSSFSLEGDIPGKHSDYREGLSVQLEWPAVEGAKSYVLIVEDPDAKPMTPFVHWVAYNIPANTTRLPEGLQKTERLTEPEGMLQGQNTRGSIGYFGPRPPVGDRAHRYYFQLLALDTTLDLLPGATRDEVLSAAKGHVVGYGNLMGRYQQAQPPRK